MPVLQPRAPQIDSQVWSSGCLHLWILVAFSAAWRGRWEMREEGGEGDDKGEGGGGACLGLTDSSGPGWGPVAAACSRPMPRVAADEKIVLVGESRGGDGEI